jgi:RNA polymerase primary sigma factor
MALPKELEKLFKSNKNGIVTYETIVNILPKVPTKTQSKEILKAAKENNIRLMTAAEVAKLKNLEDVVKNEEERERKKEELAEDILKDKELLEWSRSDSPVRMYLREMGHIPLLDKDEEIEIFRRIQLGEEIILDAICSIPFLIDLVLKYKEPLLNRERRVKELFKNFVDEEEIEDEDSKEGKRAKKITLREKRINELFKNLEKAKKEWEKVLDEYDKVINDTEMDELERLHKILQLTFKKKKVKEALNELGYTSKLINEIVKTVERRTWLNDELTPYELYLKFLYEFFGEELELLDKEEEFPLPEGFKKLRYQIEAVLDAERKLNLHSGVFLSDVVGLGKTYIAAMLASKLRKRTLIVAPPHLKEYWEDTFREFGVLYSRRCVEIIATRTR